MFTTFPFSFIMLLFWCILLVVFKSFFFIFYVDFLILFLFQFSYAFLPVHKAFVSVLQPVAAQSKQWNKKLNLILSSVIWLLTAPSPSQATTTIIITIKMKAKVEFRIFYWWFFSRFFDRKKRNPMVKCFYHYIHMNFLYCFSMKNTRDQRPKEIVHRIFIVVIVTVAVVLFFTMQHGCMDHAMIIHLS